MYNGNFFFVKYLITTTEQNHTPFLSSIQHSPYPYKTNAFSHTNTPTSHNNLAVFVMVAQVSLLAH